MAHKPETHELAKQLYLIEGKEINDIAKQIGVPFRTLMRWRKQEKWDSFLRTGNIELSMQVEKELIQLINKGIKDGNLADPKTADALSKLQKILNSLRPRRQILGNLLLFCEELANYASNCDDSEFAKAIQKHLPNIADHIKYKYNHK